jgi:hypothetical protein
MSTLKFHELENLYDELAAAIDASGPEQESVFLAKLVLSLAQEFGDAARITELIQDCLHEPVAQPAAGARLV